MRAPYRLGELEPWRGTKVLIKEGKPTEDKPTKRELISSGADGGDLLPDSLPEECLHGRPEESLEGLFRLLERTAIQTADWYLQEKRSKARWSRGLRLLAIALASVGGLIPLMALGGIGYFNPVLGYLLLGASAGTVAFDRLFGFSSAWMRYVTTAMSLERLLVEFQLEWARSRALASGSDGLGKQFDILCRFGSAVALAVEEETGAWASEFGMNIHGFETRMADHSKGRGAQL